MGFLQRGLLLYLCIALAIAFASPQIIFSGNSPAQNTVLSWFNLQLNQSCLVTTASTDQSNCIVTSSAQINPYVSNYSSSFTTPSSPASSGSLIGFIDPVFQVFSWVGVFFKTLFSPIILLSSPAMAGAPPAIMLLFGIPIVFMLIVGLIIWIRSGFP